MLIQFRVENHRSLRDEQTLSLVAASSRSDRDDCLIRSKGLNEALLPAVALYGANASGKTNVLLALYFMRRAVLESHRLWEPQAGIPQESFALSDRQNATSLYEVDVVLANVRYRYGFVLSSWRIEEEWLYAWPNGHKQTWFEREADNFAFGRHFGGENETIRGLTRQDSLYLSAGAQNNHLALLPVFGWFQDVEFSFPSARSFGLGPSPIRENSFDRIVADIFLEQIGLHKHPKKEDRRSIIRLLAAADTGIVDLRVERDGSPDERGRSRGPSPLYFKHKTDDPERAWLPMEVESAGTLALLGLASQLLSALRAGGVLCVDEIESSLHPMLAGSLLQMFCAARQNPHGAQLILTTHDTNLLGNVLGGPSLRRDQIWLTEKNDVGATSLYPLTDFHPRKHENLERGYLQGRYGAVPFLGELLDNDVVSEQP